MNGTPEMTLAAVKMVLSLVVVLAIIWGLYRFTRRGLNSGPLVSQGSLIRILASRYLGVKKSITLVQVPGSVLVLGISADRVSLLSKIEDPQLIAGVVNQNAPAPPKSFREQLFRMLHPMQTHMTPTGQEEEIQKL